MLLMPTNSIAEELILTLVLWVHLQYFPWDHYPAWKGNQSHVKHIWIHCWFMWHLALINSNEEMAVWDFLTSHEIHFAGQKLLTDGSNLGLRSSSVAQTPLLQFGPFLCWEQSLSPPRFFIRVVFFKGSPETSC